MFANTCRCCIFSFFAQIFLIKHTINVFDLDHLSFLFLISLRFLVCFFFLFFFFRFYLFIAVYLFVCLLVSFDGCYCCAAVCCNRSHCAANKHVNKHDFLHDLQVFVVKFFFFFFLTIFAVFSRFLVSFFFRMSCCCQCECVCQNVL